MNRQERRRWMRRHVASELAARATRDPGDHAPPREVTNGAPEERPSSLPFELADEEPVTPTAPDAPPAPVTPPTDHAAPPDTDASVDLLARAAREAAIAGDRGRAIGIYRELLAHDPSNVGARRRLASLLEQGGDVAAALEQIEQCLVEHPDTSLLVTRAAILGSLCRFADAERDLRDVLRTEPANAEAHFQLGVVTSRKGLWRNAIPYLRRAVELDSGRAAAHHSLGEALNHVDDLDGALQSFQRAAELRPNHAKTLYGLGIVLDRLNRPDDAAQMYRRSRELAGR